MSLAKIAASVLVALVASACVSRLDPRLPPDIRARIEAQHSPGFRAHLLYEPGAKVPASTCDQELAEVRALLSKSPWFDSVEAEIADATLVIVVHPPERTPYWHYPTHNLVPMLLALVIPVPWKDLVGYRLTATVPDSQRQVRIDTNRELNAVSWILAPLLNLSPDRVFAVTGARELAHVHAQLLPLIEGRSQTRGPEAEPVRSAPER